MAGGDWDCAGNVGGELRSKITSRKQSLAAFRGLLGSSDPPVPTISFLIRTLWPQMQNRTNMMNHTTMIKYPSRIWKPPFCTP